VTLTQQVKKHPGCPGRAFLAEIRDANHEHLSVTLALGGKRLTWLLSAQLPLLRQ
jgi:hypothetical protein